MSQSVIVALLSLMLFISNLFGGLLGYRRTKGTAALPAGDIHHHTARSADLQLLYESPSTDSQRTPLGSPTSVSSY